MAIQKISINKFVKPDYRANEAFKRLRTNIQFSGSDVKVIALTSCVPNDGKSTVSFNLAVSFAEMGKKVLFIDADLRKSVLIGKYKISRAVNGFTHYLSGMKSIEEVIYSTNIDNLNIIFPDATKELLQYRKKALQYVANNYGYDFQKPFKVTGLLGKFTAKSIEKATVSNCGILLICKGSNVKCVRLNKGKFDIDARNGYEYSIDYYCSKKIFETDRKSGKLGMFIIQQDDKYKRVVKNTFTNSYSFNRDEFDKSGCNITKTRRQLDNRLYNYKANKRKREVDAISYESELKNIKEMFSKLKSELILKLSKTETVDGYEKIRDVFDYTFVLIVKRIKSLENKIIQNGFCSIKEATDSITILKNDITDKMKKIEG